MRVCSNQFSFWPFGKAVKCEYVLELFGVLALGTRKVHGVDRMVQETRRVWGACSTCANWATQSQMSKRGYLPGRTWIGISFILDFLYKTLFSWKRRTSTMNDARHPVKWASLILYKPPTGFSKSHAQEPDRPPKNEEEKSPDDSSRASLRGAACNSAWEEGWIANWLIDEEEGWKGIKHIE